MNVYLLGTLWLCTLIGYEPQFMPAPTQIRPPIVMPQPPNDDTRDFPVQAFEQLKISDAFTVNVKAGSGFSVNATGRSADLDAMDVSLRKGVLTIQYKPIKMGKDQSPVINREVVKVTVTLPSFKRVEFQKQASFTIEGFDRFETIELVANSQSKGSVDVKANRMKLTIDGQSSVTVRGETGQLDARLQGESELMAYDLKTRSTSIAVVGMSKAQVSVSEALQATANGSSQISYKGKPTLQSSGDNTSTINGQTP